MSDKWKQYGSCREFDPAIWFPDREGGKSGDTRSAKAICSGCDVRRECGEYALERREPYGVWGGMTSPERRVVLAKRAAAEREARQAV